MKHACFFYITIILWSTIQCHVTKYVEVTTDEPVTETVPSSKYEFKKISDEQISLGATAVSESDYLESKKISENEYNNESQLSESFSEGRSSSASPRYEGKPENKIEDKKNIMKQKSIENVHDLKKSVYLEDVVFALKNQDWAAEEQPCLNSTLHLLRSLQNFTLWAVWDWDSISSQPQGLLFGNRFELGNFDECMGAPWADTHPELKTQYCLAEIVLERTDNPVRRRIDRPVQPYESAVDFVLRNKSSIYRALNELTWGGCMPVSCGPRSVERLMAALLARSHLGAAGMRARITVSEPCQRPDQPHEFDNLFYAFIIFVVILVGTSLICTYLHCRRNLGPKSFKDEIIQCFCLRENAKNLMEMKKEGAEVVYGIRFLTIIFIVMDHQIGIFNSGPIINGLQADQEALSVVGMFVLHDDLFVDTFFVLSGFFVAVAFLKLRNEKHFNPVLLIVKRYIRLVVAFAVVIFFYVGLYPYIGSGPLWNRSIGIETDPCRKNWWLSLLMLSNYIDNENICIVISWYIPCDFHYFVVAVLLFWLYKRCPRVALSCAGVLTVASLLAPGIINYMKGLPAIQLFTYDFVKNPRASEQFHITYIKSHVRFTAYIVGIFAGYIFAYYKDTGKLKIISKSRSIIGAVSGMVIMTAVMVGGTTYLWRSYHPLEGAVYAALNRPIWACGVALVILCCCLGRVPFLEEFLSWYPWVPLSRLAYGLYLTHTALIMRNVFVIRSPQRNDYASLLTSSAGVVVLGCMASLAIWLFAEAPVNGLFTVLVKSKIRRVMSENSDLPECKEKPSVSPTASTSSNITSGHLHSNLPSTIEITSKM